MESAFGQIGFLKKTRTSIIRIELCRNELEKSKLVVTRGLHDVCQILIAVEQAKAATWQHGSDVTDFYLGQQIAFSAEILDIPPLFSAP